MIYVCKCRIQSALSRLIKDKTVMVIAHRMRTVAGADKIVVLSDGKVAETGTPDELMKKDGIFAHMSKLQAQGQTWSLEGKNLIFVFNNIYFIY